MIKKICFIIVCVSICVGCELQGVKNAGTPGELSGMDSINEQNMEDGKIEDNEYEQSTQNTTVPLDKVDDTLELDNGIIITFYKKGEGPLLTKGDMVKIAYRSRLEDGTVFDGNHLVHKASIPFLVGWNQQTKGWDIALEHLRVGADVDVFIPSKLGRGDKGIKGVIPPNSNTILSLRIVSKFEPMVDIDGIKLWKYDELEEPGDSIDNKDEVHINYFVSSESNPRYDNSYKKREVYKLHMGDASLMPGLEKALKYGREGDRLMILIPSAYAFGEKGLFDLVQPNEDIFYDLQIAKVIKIK